MEITIKAEAKEIAALVVAIQERRVGMGYTFDLQIPDFPDNTDRWSNEQFQKRG